jgi:hypothetical protein
VFDILSNVSKYVELLKLRTVAKSVRVFHITVNLAILTTAALLPTLYLLTPLTAIAEEFGYKDTELRVKQSKQPFLIASEVDFLSGTWQGTYICPQGLTNIKLVIDAKNASEIDAVFIFYANASNQTVPSGSFQMQGNFKNLNSREIPNVLELKATKWISHPSGYITVDLQGNVLPSQDRIVGNVLNAPGCSNFDVVKVRE